MFCCDKFHFAGLAPPWAQFKEIAIVQRGIFRLFNFENTTKFKYIFSPSWHKCTPMYEKTYPIARHIYRKLARHIGLHQQWFQWKQNKNQVHFYVLPVSRYCLSWTEWQFVALIKPILCLMSKRIALCNKNFSGKSWQFYWETKKICKPVASILTLKHIPVAYDESA